MTKKRGHGLMSGIKSIDCGGGINNTTEQKGG
jgi:hypothetical protein